METLKRWWPTILPVAIALFTALAPFLQTWIAHHPLATMILNGAGWVVAALKKSPLQKN